MDFKNTNFDDLDRVSKAILLVLYRSENMREMTVKEVTKIVNRERLHLISDKEFNKKVKQAIKKNDKQEVEKLLKNLIGEGEKNGSEGN